MPMAKTEIPSRSGSYPWHLYATGEWVNVRHTPKSAEKVTGITSLAEYLRENPHHTAHAVSGQLRISAAKWARKHGYHLNIRSDEVTRMVWVRFTRKS